MSKKTQKREGFAALPFLLRSFVVLRQADFRHLGTEAAAAGIEAAQAILLDLGLSSYQLARSGRGFSFQADEPGFEHQPSMPEGIEAPENLPSEMDLFSPHAERIPQPMRDKIFCAKPIQIRPVNPGDPFRPKPSEPLNMYWFKADGSLSANPALHKYLLAYASDFGLLTASLRPHGASFWQPDMQVASLDHALWFHRDLKMDDWHLYVQESPWSGGARGFSRGSIFNRTGELVASVAQEGLIRRRESRA